MDKKVVITKVDGGKTDAPKKTVKTFPRGILKTSKLKLKGVSNPTKAPPKKGVLKHTLKLLTDKGLRKHRKTLKKKISKLSDTKVKEVMSASGLSVNETTPPAVAREILDNAVSAGFVSL